MSIGTKEIDELVDGVEAVGVPVAAAFADGKLNMLDLPQLLALVQANDKIIAAVQGIGGIPAEAKDIDASEAQAIVMKLFQVAKKIKDASKAA